MEILGFIVLIACLVIGVRFGGLGLAAVSGIGLTFFVFVVGLVPGKPPIDVMLTIMAVVTCSYLFRIFASFKRTRCNAKIC